MQRRFRIVHAYALHSIVSLFVIAFVMCGLTQYVQATDYYIPLDDELKMENKVAGDYADAEGLLTYSDDGNGGVVIMSCSERVQGELYLPDTLDGKPVTGIHDYAFLYCAGLKGVTVPASVTKIGDSAFSCSGLQYAVFEGENVTLGARTFYYCTALERLECNAVQTIGPYAFYKCTRLETVTFPEGLVSVGEGAFQATGLTGVTLPEGVLTIGESAFQDCTTLVSARLPESLHADGAARLFSGCTALETANIPAATTVVPDEMFYNCKLLNMTELPAVTSIGEKSFYSCDSLQHLAFQEGLVRIGADAFAWSENLKSVNLPESATEVGEMAFAFCVSLEQAHLSADMTVIPDRLFDGCRSLHTLNLPGGLTKIGKQPFGGYRFEGELTLSAGLTEIGESAFENHHITSVSLSEGLTQLGTRAFSNNMLTEITLPSTLTDFGSAAFGGCPITTLHFPADWTYIPASLFRSLPALESVVIPEGIIGIQENAFSDCTGLQRVTLPLSLREIGEGAFSGCTALKEITFPETLTALSGFNGFTGEGVILPEGLETIGVKAFADSALTQITIPASVHTIEKQAFSGCAALKSVTLQEGLAVLGAGAFQNCTSLSYLELPSTVDLEELTGSNVYAVQGIFTGCTALDTVVFSEGRTDIPRGILQDCTALKTVVLPQSLKVIHWDAFHGCTGLENITLPEGLEVIGFDAFADCTSLKFIRLPASLTQIQADAFAGSGLVSVELAEGLSQDSFWLSDSKRDGFLNDYGTASVGARMTSPFRACHALQSITIPESWTALPDYFLHKCEGMLELSLPDGLTVIGTKSLYQAGLVSLTLPEGLPQENITSSSFGMNPNLKQVDLPVSWTTIPAGLFEGNEILTEYTIPERITEIGARAFANTKLREITIPEGVTAVGNYAFAGCTELTHLSIPSTLKSIPLAMCFGCSALEQVTLPEGVQEIGTQAFADCAALSLVYIPDSMTVIDPNAFYASNAPNLVFDCSTGSFAAEYAELCLYIGTSQNPVPLDLQFSFDERRSEREEEYGQFLYPQVTVTVDGLQYIISFSWSKNGVLSTQAQCAGLTDETMTDVVLPDFLFGELYPVTTVRAKAFQDNTTLQIIHLPTYLTTIGDDAFSGCISLVDVNFPDELSDIGSGAFENCGLQSVDFSNTRVITVRKDVFSGCASLASVTLREGMVTIQERAFQGTELSEVYVPSSVTALDKSAFDSSVGIYITGNAEAVYHVFVDEAFGNTYYFPIVKELLEDGKVIEQFVGEGLAGQASYFIAASGTAYGSPRARAAAEAGEGAALPVAGAATPQAVQSVIVPQDIPLSPMQQDIPLEIEYIPEPEPEPEQVPQDQEIFEVVRAQAQENGARIGIAAGIALVIVALGSLARIRKAKRKDGN